MAFAEPDHDIKAPVGQPQTLFDGLPQLSVEEHNVSSTRNKVALHQDHINQMPAEILHAIFLLVQTASIYDPFSRNETGNGHIFVHSRNAPLSISQVCGYWRACAVATKELWRYIYMCDRNVLSAELVALYLDRSSPLPISFLHHDSIDRALPRLRPGSVERFYKARTENHYLIQQPQVRSRLCSISFQTNRGIVDQPVWALLTGPLPNLVDVDIRFSICADIDDEYGELIHQDEFMRLLQDCAPRLRRLSLIDGRYDSWLDGRFKGLVELHLMHTGHTLVLFDTLVSILETIGGNLEVLCLRNSIRDPYVPFEMGIETLIPGDDDDKVKMPKLRHIEIWGTPGPLHGETLRSGKFELFLLWILHIPDTAVISWEAEISLNNSYVPGKYNMPPTAHLARITSLVTSAYKESYFAIVGSTLFLDPSKIGVDSLKKWISVLPNLEADIVEI